MRDINRIKPFLNEVEKYWTGHPDIYCNDVLIEKKKDLKKLLDTAE